MFCYVIPGLFGSFTPLEALAGAVATESGSDPLRPPLLIGWEDSLSCNYLKAQQCYRLGRLALLAVAENLAAAKAC